MLRTAVILASVLLLATLTALSAAAGLEDGEDTQDVGPSAMAHGVLVGVFAGLGASLLWSLLILAYLFAKDLCIRLSFRRSIRQRKEVAWTVGWIGVPIHNMTWWPVIVRTVWLEAPGEPPLVLSYEGSLSPIYANHILLKPRVWGVWTYPLEDAPKSIEDAGVDIEYQTPLRGSRVLRVRLHPKHLKMVQETWRKGVESLENMGPPIIVPALDPEEPA